MQRLLPISPGNHQRGIDLVFAAEGLWKHGVRQLIVRESHLEERPLVTLLRALAPRAKELIVHANCAGAEELARSGCWGLHLPGGCDVAEIRARNPRKRLGVSVHSQAEAVAAAAAGADYVLISPAFSPLSKPDDERPTLGISGVAQVQHALSIPVFALGGMTPQRAADCRRAGVFGAAGIGNLFGDGASPEWISSQTAAFREALEQPGRDHTQLSLGLGLPTNER